MEAGTGETELHLASQFGHTKLVEDLLESASYAFEVDAPGCGNASALMSALGNGYVEGGREGERKRVRGAGDWPLCAMASSACNTPNSQRSLPLLPLGILSVFRPATDTLVRRRCC